MSDTPQEAATKAVNALVEILGQKSVGPEEQRELDARAQQEANARFKAQMESQAKTQQIHLRSVAACEREAAAWERIAAALECLAAALERK